MKSARTCFPHVIFYLFLKAISFIWNIHLVFKFLTVSKEQIWQSNRMLHITITNFYLFRVCLHNFTDVGLMLKNCHVICYFLVSPYKYELRNWYWIISGQWILEKIRTMRLPNITLWSAWDVNKSNVYVQGYVAMLISTTYPSSIFFTFPFYDLKWTRHRREPIT